MSVRYLQPTANAFIEFFRKWEIRMNTEKYQLISFTIKYALLYIEVTNNDHRLEWKKTIKYLGDRYSWV